MNSSARTPEEVARDETRLLDSPASRGPVGGDASVGPRAATPQAAGGSHTGYRTPPKPCIEILDLGSRARENRFARDQEGSRMMRAPGVFQVLFGVLVLGSAW